VEVGGGCRHDGQQAQDREEVKPERILGKIDQNLSFYLLFLFYNFLFSDASGHYITLQADAKLQS
jgi:hypothetical protein